MLTWFSNRKCNRNWIWCDRKSEQQKMHIHHIFGFCRHRNRFAMMWKLFKFHLACQLICTQNYLNDFAKIDFNISNRTLLVLWEKSDKWPTNHIQSEVCKYCTANSIFSPLKRWRSSDVYFICFAACATTVTLSSVLLVRRLLLLGLIWIYSYSNVSGMCLRV